MDFSKQCKRFLNFRIINHETHKKRFTNICAMEVLKNVHKLSRDKTATTYKLVIHDNDERCTYVIDEANGEIVAELDKTLRFEAYGIACSQNPAFIYVSDFTNNKIRKFDQALKQVGELKLDPKETKHFNGPCQISANSFLHQLHILDQKNCRVVVFDMKTDQYHSEFKLFEEDLAAITRPAEHSFRMDLTNKLKGDDFVEDPVQRAMIDFKPFGVYSKLERIYVTDWNRGFIYMYKNGLDGNYKLERKIVSKITRPRDVLLDSLDSMLVVDMDSDCFHFLDNKGEYLFETPVPRVTKSDSYFKEKGVFGLSKLPNMFIFASNSTIYMVKLNALLED